MWYEYLLAIKNGTMVYRSWYFLVFGTDTVYLVEYMVWLEYNIYIVYLLNTKINGSGLCKYTHYQLTLPLGLAQACSLHIISKQKWKSSGKYVEICLAVEDWTLYIINCWHMQINEAETLKINLSDVVSVIMVSWT